MNTFRGARLVIPAALSLLVALACLCSSSAQPAEPTAPVAPIVVGDDLTQIDVCQAIPRQDIEAVFGRKLVAEPQPFAYYDTPGAAGCWYDAGTDDDGNAYFGYVVLTLAAVYFEQPLYQDEAVTGLGQEAYFNNGVEARQLWVKISDQVALVVAFADVPREEGSLALARLIVAAMQ